MEETIPRIIKIATVCPRSRDPFFIPSFYIKWVTTSQTYSIRTGIGNLYLYLSVNDYNTNNPSNDYSDARLSCRLPGPIPRIKSGSAVSAENFPTTGDKNIANKWFQMPEFPGPSLGELCRMVSGGTVIGSKVCSNRPRVLVKSVLLNCFLILSFLYFPFSFVCMLSILKFIMKYELYLQF